MQDYDIEMEGIIINNLNGVYPLQEVTDLITYLKLGVSIYVTCPYLNDLLGVDYITIKDFTLDREKGGISYQKFNIKAVNDNLIDSDVVISPYNT